MHKLNILILEDEFPRLASIKSAFEKYKHYFNIYPKQEYSEGENYESHSYLMDQMESEKFEKILEHYKDIDLFIVDLEIGKQDRGKKTNRIGNKFLNKLKELSYRTGNYKYIICSKHNIDSIGVLNLEFRPDLNYVYKTRFRDFPNRVVEKAIKLLQIESIPLPPAKQKFWEELPAIIENHIINRIVLFVLYFLVIATTVYAFVGVCFETITKVHGILIPTEERDSTDLLKYVEDIYLYVLPLFIIFSFVNYYKSTMEIRFVGGDASDIDHDNAMKSLNNSKFILLTSLLSFTIIKIIENVFIGNQPDVVELISYGVFVIILMIFILLQNRHTKESS